MVVHVVVASAVFGSGSWELALVLPLPIVTLAFVNETYRQDLSR